MTDSDNRYGDTPLGKSVEEVEQEGGNLESPPAADGELWNNDQVALPAIANANASAVPAVINPSLNPENEGTGTREGEESTG
ncbi:hypothetical protein V3W47_07170 [Deinococcus sp. YIM 134068]|uniref:hypothetical protein n=1 Tax=Deinococcus lichenicola TaxID=3118910 RepID=UPI002F95224B